jgi:hypothetical protein
MLRKDYDRKGSVAKKSLVVSLKGFDAKTNWLAGNRQSLSNSDSGPPLPRVEAGSNTSTVALRVVGGNGKGTQFLVV